MSGAGRVGTRIDRRLAKVNSSGAHAALLGAVLPSYKSTVCLLCLSIVLTFAQYCQQRPYRDVIIKFLLVLCTYVYSRTPSLRIDQ